MVRHLRRPEATDIAIVQIALGGLAQSSRTAGRVHFPAGRKDDRTSHRIVRPRRRRSALLQRVNAAPRGRHLLIALVRFAISRPKMFHNLFLLSKCSKYWGFCAAIAP